MSQDGIKAIWQTIKNRFLPRREAGKFLYYWILGTIFIVPLLVFNYGFNASAIRQLVLFILVVLGFLIWLGPVLFRNKKFNWQPSIFSFIALVLFIAVLLVSFLAKDIPEVWGWRGTLGESNPWGWLGTLGLCLLITQIPKFQTTKNLLISYLLSSTLLALFVLAWWGINQELVMPALTSFGATSLFFTVNAIIITAWALPLRGRIKWFWLGVLFIHLLVIFVYDYNLAWYLFGAGMLALNLLQLLLEKKLASPFAKGGMDFITPFILIGLSLVLLFAPVQAISKKLGFDFSKLNSVSAAVSYPRFFQHASWREKLLGAGLGQGAEFFWEKAELVDMRQVRQFPPLGNGFSALLWDGGIIFILFWLGTLIYLGIRIWRSVKKSSGEDLQIILVLAIGVISAIAALALLPFDWVILFASLVLMALLSARLGVPKDAAIGLSHGQRSFLTLGAVLISALAGVLIFFSARQISSRLDFFQSIKVGDAKAGTTVDLKLLDSVINRAGGVYGYRLARIDLTARALQEKAAKELDPEQADVKPLLVSLAGDYDYLSNRDLSGSNLWQLAARAEAIAQAIGKEPGALWYQHARELYDKAIERLSRNVIVLTDAARFYGQYAATLDNPDKDKFYQRALELTGKALAIDGTYDPAYGEQADLLVLQGRSAEAYDIMKKLADKGPAAAYGAARLAFSGKKYGEAVVYYKKAIAQNPNHLQARYELVQAYMALSDFKSATLELDELEKRAPKDNAATQNLLKGLRELLKKK